MRKFTTARCIECQNEWLGVNAEHWVPEPCDLCGSEMSLTGFSTECITIGWPEEGITMEHVGPEPVHFKSRTEAKQYARENNVELGCL